MDNKNTNNTETITEEELMNDFKEFCNPFSCMCLRCLHKNVCAIKNRAEIPCKEFLENDDYKTYGNVYNLFQPIFDWIQYHYPSGEVIFIVDKNSAKMHLEHGVSAYCKRLREFTDSISQKPDSSERQSK